MTRAVIQGDALRETEVRVVENLEIEIGRDGERDEECEEEEKQ